MSAKYYVSISLVCSILLAVSCQSKKGNVLQNQPTAESSSDRYFINKRGDTIRKVVFSESEWKSRLNDMEFYVLRKKGTERAFTGDLLENKNEGLYTCRGCGMPLFRSKHKFDSGTGWPSFYDVDDPYAITKTTDHDLGYPRTELTCAKCGGHLGHVFDDGPAPTGLRYCINAVSLDFVKAENSK